MTTTWQYPQIVITDLLVGFSGGSQQIWKTGSWSISFVTTLPTNIDVVRTDTNILMYLVNPVMANSTNIYALKSDGTKRRFLTMLSNNQMYFCQDGDDAYFGGRIITANTNGIATGRFTVRDGFMSIHSTATDAQNNTNPNLKIGMNGTASALQLQAITSNYIGLVVKDVSSLITFGPEGIYPGQDNARSCGWSTYRWNRVYATNAAISTSDKRLKKDIKEIDDKYIKLFKKLRPVTYMFNSKKSDRIHTGFISQEVKEAMDEVGLSDLEFAAYCCDKKQVQDPDTGEWTDILDENGNPDYIYSLAYEEFIALNTKMIQDLMTIVENQQKEIELLKEALNIQNA